MSNILVFFGGWWRPSRNGDGLTRTDQHGIVRTSAIAYDRLSGLFTDSFAVNPALDDRDHNGAIDRTLDFLRPRLAADRNHKVVLYGFSAGGFNALRLSERIAADSRLGGHRINLLVTVDPCLRLLETPAADWYYEMRSTSRWRTRAPRPTVTKHVNYYQTRDPDYRGCRTDGAEANVEFPQGDVNRAMTRRSPRSPSGDDVNHDRMPTLSLRQVITEIHTCLHGRSAVGAGR